MSQLVELVLPDFQPIYLNPKDPSNAVRFGPITLSIDKFIKSGLLQIQATLTPMHSTYKGNRLDKMSDLKKACSDILDQRAFQPLQKNKQVLINELKSLISPPALEFGRVTLKNLKTHLIEVLKNNLDQPTFLEKIGTIVKTFDAQKKLDDGWVKSLNTFNPKINEKIQKLHRKIVLFETHPRPPKHVLDSLYLRTDGAFSRTYIEQQLDASDQKHRDRLDRFNTLTADWNQLVVTLTEILTYEKAIGMIKQDFSDIAEFRLKLKDINKELTAKQEIIIRCENFLDYDYNYKTPEKNPQYLSSSPTAEELKTLDTWEEFKIKFENVSREMREKNDAIQTTLIRLQQICNKNLFKPEDLSTTSNKIFTETNKNKSTFIEELIHDLRNEWKKINTILVNTEKEYNFLFSISKFIKDMTSAVSENLTLASSLRNLRLPGRSSAEYESAHCTAKFSWERMCAAIYELIKERSSFKISGTNSLNKSTETKADSFLKDDKDIKLVQLEKSLELFDQYLKNKLAPANRALASELNRGADALTRKKDYPDNFSKAFHYEKVYNAVSLLPDFLTLKTSPQDTPPLIPYVSPFDET